MAEWNREERPPFEIPATREEILQLKIRINGERGRIQDQLSRRRSEQEAAGEKPDWDWIRRANGALKFKATQLFQLDQALARLKEQSSARLENCFINAAREVLPEQQFQRLMDIAHDRQRYMEASSLVSPSFTPKDPVDAEPLVSSNSAR